MLVHPDDTTATAVISRLVSNDPEVYGTKQKHSH